MFDDDDAEAVKGLDDLGGGRLHANRAEVKQLTAELLSGMEKHGRMARQFQRKGQELPPASRLTARNNRVSQLGIMHVNDMPIRSFGPKYAATAPPLQTKTNQVKPRKEKGISKVTQPAAIKPTAVQENKQKVSGVEDKPSLPEKPPVITDSDQIPKSAEFQSKIKYLDDRQQLVLGMVYLSKAPPPDPGYFTLIVEGKMICHWPLSQWQNFLNKDNGVIIKFRGIGGKDISYDLLFREKSTFLDFISTLSRLRDMSQTEATTKNHYKDQAMKVENHQLTSSCTLLDELEEGEIREDCQGFELGDSATPQVSQLEPVSPAGVSPQLDSKSPTLLSPLTIFPAGERLRMLTQGTESEERAEVAAESQENPNLIDLSCPVEDSTLVRTSSETGDLASGTPTSSSHTKSFDITNDVAASHEPTTQSATELLATLDPIDYGDVQEEITEDPETKAKMFEMRKHLDDVLGPMINIFRLAGKTGPSEDELRETIQNIKHGMVENYKTLSRRGYFFPDLDESDRERVFTEFLALPFEIPHIEELPISVPTTTSTSASQDTAKDPGQANLQLVASEYAESQLSSTRRIEYSEEELLKLKVLACPPPAQLALLDFLPPPRQPARSTTDTIKGPKSPCLTLTKQHSPRTTLEPRGALPVIQENVLDPVQGLQVIIPAENERASLISTASAITSRSSHKGLASSRWAAEDPMIESKDVFTGLGF
jgi:hypothetical protein